MWYCTNESHVRRKVRLTSHDHLISSLYSNFEDETMRQKSSDIFSICDEFFKFENWLKNWDVWTSRRFIFMTEFVLIIDVCLQMFIIAAWFVWIMIDFSNDCIKCLIFLIIQIRSTISNSMSQWFFFAKMCNLLKNIIVGTLVRRWTSSSNQRWFVRHYLPA
jgi:hypothetical protein